MSTPTGTDRLTLRGPEDVLAKIPFLVGFHPEESLVTLTFDEDRELTLTARADLPEPDLTPQELRAAGDRLACLVFAREVRYCLLVAYTTTRARATPALRAAVAAFSDVDVTVLDAIVADGRRWWSDVCADPACCPPEGKLYDLASHPLTARSIYRGEVALAGQEEFRRTVAPPTGAAREAAEQAVARVLSAGPGGSVGAGVAAGLFARTGRGDRLSDEEVARVAVGVSDVAVRDAFWSRITRESAGRHVEFWSDVVRRTVPPHDVAPAALLAFAAWLQGQGALARCALERVHAGDPDYSMARLIEQVLRCGIPPEAWEPPVVGS
ncbi:DUF4192 domain-containing protein [Actinopolymorpha singaporensis]|uniref:DUF4192 domain-containing protein n=1 Tax=Actinopolymorpha singaporensis TaxID=117157 RepID=A0A1H1WBV9_9ACTN|nr:DUF4192 domain-containing protein [Actinopolymorpha singaporensis]SDS94593.1 protein of unknown function [Actinopolymorpha singaporensis]